MYQAFQIRTSPNRVLSYQQWRLGQKNFTKSSLHVALGGLTTS